MVQCDSVQFRWLFGVNTARVIGFTLTPDAKIWATQIENMLKLGDANSIKKAARQRIIGIFTNESFSN